jgi:two-component system phosphate regulon sensor histidine kinase PhoR
MWRSRLFWRLFGTCGVVWLAMMALLALLTKPSEEQPHLLWLLASATGLANLFLAFWLARRMTPPLRELAQMAEQIAQGRFEQKVYAVSNDEVEALARAFNRMSGRLAARIAELEDDRQQLRTILSGMVEGVIALDPEQRILFSNDRAAQLLEFQSQSVVGRKLWQVVRLRALQEVVGRALAGTEPTREELLWKGQANRSLTVHAARLPGGAARGAVLVLHDTSELRRLERMRQEFFTNVSHELKTPLSSIKICLETLLNGAVDDLEHRGRFLEQAAEQANRLHALILDMLSLGRIESGAETLELESVPLEQVVAECLERHRARAESKQQILEAVPPAEETRRQGDKETGSAEADRTVSPDLPVSLSPCLSTALPLAAWADEEALSQILDNLVDNAVKYTPRGGRISVRWRAEDEQVCLEVQDSGVGIPEADLPRIFERFYRVDKARARELGGAGLGLSIVKHLVQAMRGSVRATSQVGSGTTFVVWLPRPQRDFRPSFIETT